MSRLYLITPPQFDAATFPSSLAAALDAGDVACVQLRMKHVNDDGVRRAADLLRPIVQDRGAAFLMNDRADLALSTGCDGVHIGQEDQSYDEARRILGLGRIIGVTCHASRHLAVDAAEMGANYVAFGAFFPTATKLAKGVAEPELLHWWNEIMIVPSVAIGGITPENCGVLVKAGADFIAVIAAVWNHPEGPAAAVKAFAKAIAEAR